MNLEHLKLYEDLPCAVNGTDFDVKALGVFNFEEKGPILRFFRIDQVVTPTGDSGEAIWNDLPEATRQGIETELRGLLQYRARKHWRDMPKPLPAFHRLSRTNLPIVETDAAVRSDMHRLFKIVAF